MRKALSLVVARESCKLAASDDCVDSAAEEACKARVAEASSFEPQVSLSGWQSVGRAPMKARVFLLLLAIACTCFSGGPESFAGLEAGKCALRALARLAQSATDAAKCHKRFWRRPSNCKRSRCVCVCVCGAKSAQGVQLGELTGESVSVFRCSLRAPPKPGGGASVANAGNKQQAKKQRPPLNLNCAQLERDALLSLRVSQEQRFALAASSALFSSLLSLLSALCSLLSLWRANAPLAFAC